MKKTLSVLIFLIFIITISTRNSWFVGISSNSILPLVNGSLNYVKDFPETDLDSPGVFVPKFDVGESTFILIKKKKSNCW
jgi:hypothetical protein